MSNNTGKRFRVWRAVLILLALFAAIVIALPFVLDIDAFRTRIESGLSDALGREVKIGNLVLSLFSSGIRADNVSIADNPAFSHAPFVTSKSLQINVELTPLIFSREVRITGLLLNQPVITLIHSPSGKWNFSDLTSRVSTGNETSGDPSPDLDISVRQLKISDGRVSIIEGSRKPAVYQDVQIDADNLSFAASFPFSVSASIPGGGTLELEGKAGPLNRTDALRTPLTASVSVTGFDFVASGFAPSDSGLSGLLSFRGTVTSDGFSARSEGHAEIDKLQVVKGGTPAAKAVSMRFALDYDLAKEKGTISDGEVQCGTAIARLSGDYDRHGDNLTLKMALHGSAMPLQELLELLPAFGVTLPRGASLEGGTLNSDLTAEGPIGRIVIAGTVDISETRLIGYDLSGELAQLATLAGLESNRITTIEKFASAVRMTPEGTYVNNLLLVIPALGVLSGEGKVAADSSLNFAMRARLKPSGVLGSALSRLAKGGTLNIPFHVLGTASDPEFIPDLGNIATGVPGSRSSGHESKEGQSNSDKSLGDLLRDLLKKEK